MKYYVKYILWVSCFLLSIDGFSRTVLLPECINKNIDIRSCISIYKTTSDVRTFNQVRALNVDSCFSRYSGYNTLNNKNDYWITFNVKNTSDSNSNYILELGYLLALDLYVVYPDTVILFKSGVLNQKNDVVFDLNTELNLNSPSHEEVSIYALLEKPGFSRSTALNIVFEKPDIFLNKHSWRKFLDGLFLGILMIMVLYNGSIYLFRQNKAYLYYALYMFFLGINFIGYRDIFAERVCAYVYPQQITAFGAITYLFYLLFIRSYSNIYNFNKKFDLIFKWVIILDFAYYLLIQLVPIAFFNDWGIDAWAFGMLFNKVNLVVIFLLSIFLAINMRKRSTIKFIFIGSLFMLGGFFISNQFEILYADQVGVVIEIVFFSIGMGYRINHLDVSQRKTQGSLIKELKKNQRFQIESNKRLKEHALEIKNKNNEITSSINYAKRIQTSMLPSTASFKEAFAESFIMFKPLNIVSGDFYWLHKTEHLTFFAVIDCTGHGVPGALMSMQANAILNQIVVTQKIIYPNQILEELDRHIRVILHQDRTGNRDGMDVSLCLFDSRDNTLFFSGAINPLIYFQDDELRCIKGSRRSIGGHNLHVESEYSLHKIKIDKPTCLYLFSDGYQDQIGGKHGKKLYASNFRKILEKIHHESFDEQKDILDQRLTDWMGDSNSQTDDVLVMGVKIGI